MTDKTLFEHILSSELNANMKVDSFSALSGGCIHRAFKVLTDHGVFFIKLNASSRLHMFEVEAKGLMLLSEHGAVKTPEIYAFGSCEGHSYLLTEYIVPGIVNDKFWTGFGEQLAELHRISHVGYGMQYDNYIGSLVQANTFMPSWIEFFIANRLEPQLRLAEESNKVDMVLIKQFRLLYDKLSTILGEDKPSLLHGDLWSGNFLANNNNEVVLIDPAVYFGDREIEIAFTKLFGGFSERFYDAYFSNLPVENEFSDRIDIYNLYPLLVHLNLFGSSYLSQIKAILNRFV